jgi:hypothetical protein
MAGKTRGVLARKVNAAFEEEVRGLVKEALGDNKKIAALLKGGVSKNSLASFVFGGDDAAILDSTLLRAAIVLRKSHQVKLADITLDEEEVEAVPAPKTPAKKTATKSATRGAAAIAVTNEPEEEEGDEEEEEEDED